MTLTPASIASIAYGLLALIGGIIGYRQAGSQMSLISGIVSGVLLVVSGILQLNILQLGGSAAGLWLGAIVTAVLIIVFAIRFAKTRKFMPAGLMIITGTIALLMIVPQISILIS